MGKVLVVDDDPDVVDSLKAVLHREPFEILAAGSAEVARGVLAKEPVGAIVIDERLPGKSGSEFLEEVARAYPDVPRIMLTGYADLDLALRSINNGEVFKFLQKPCRADELATTIRQALQRRAVTTTKERILDLSRRQASLVEALARGGAGNGAGDGGAVDGAATPAPTPGPSVTATQELASEPNNDPVSFLPAFEAELLSRREKEILRLLVTGRRPQDIATTLFISVHTARNHIKAIYQKLGVHSQGELIAKVLRAPGRDGDASADAGRARSA
jgi:DNA-binding NarL/FixJ family response regulator